MKFVPSKIALFSSYSISLIYLILLLLAWKADPLITAENRLMENLQAIALAIALVFSLLNLSPMRSTLSRVPNYVTAGLAVFFLTLMLREVDVEKLGLPAILASMGSGTGKILLLGLLWVAILLAMVRNRHRLKGDMLALMRSPLLYFMVTAGIFYVAGEVLDKRLFPMAKTESLFWEEAAECLATLWYVLGMMVWTFSKQSPFSSSQLDAR